MFPAETGLFSVSLRRSWEMKGFSDEREWTGRQTSVIVLHWRCLLKVYRRIIAAAKAPAAGLPVLAIEVEIFPISCWGILLIPADRLESRHAANESRHFGLTCRGESGRSSIVRELYFYRRIRAHVFRVSIRFESSFRSSKRFLLLKFSNDAKKIRKMQQWRLMTDTNLYGEVLTSSRMNLNDGHSLNYTIQVREQRWLLINAIIFE